MKKPVEHQEDLLRKYIYPGKIENAPDGLADKIMAQINVQKRPVPARGIFLIDYSVPLVSGAVTIMLIILSVILEPSGSDSYLLSLFKPLIKCESDGMKITWKFLSGISIPSIIVYTVLGIFLLSMLDHFLNNAFQRRKWRDNNAEIRS